MTSKLSFYAVNEVDKHFMMILNCALFTTLTVAVHAFSLITPFCLVFVLDDLNKSSAIIAVREGCM